MPFRTDRILPYRNGIWEELGFAVPNFGDNAETLNQTIWRLTEAMGRNLLATMSHQDARLRTVPTVNTLVRIKKLCDRFRYIVAARVKNENEPFMEAVHATPSPEPFLIFPVPYFKVENPWMREYCGLVLMALSEAMQHTDNSREFDISENFAQTVGQYIRRIYRMVAVELLQIPREQAEQPDFVITDEMISNYAPSKWFTATELIDTPRIDNLWTEDDLKPLSDGIRATELVGMVANLPPRPMAPQPQTVPQGEATVPPFPSEPTP